MRFDQRDFDRLCREITLGIVNDVNEGLTTRWVTPWAGGGPCFNARTHRLYRGELNILILSCVEASRGYGSSGWLTERQVRRWGGAIRFGEKPTTIVLGRPGHNGRPGYGNLIQVFNVDQCDGIPPPSPLPDPDFMWSFPRLERMIEASGADFRVGGRHGFYHVNEDYIQVPPPSSYFQPIDFVRTCIHELGHWTQHPARLNRTPLDSAKHVAIAREELLVELATAFVIARLRVYSNVRSPSYIGDWLQYAKAESSYLFDLAPPAQAIAEFILCFDRDSGG